MVIKYRYYHAHGNSYEVDIFIAPDIDQTFQKAGHMYLREHELIALKLQAIPDIRIIWQEVEK